MGRLNPYADEELQYEDFGLGPDLGDQTVVQTAPTGVAATPAPSPVNQAPIAQGIAALPSTATAPPDYSGLSKQISDYWSKLKIDPTIKGVNRADELARLLSSQGITEFDPLGFGFKETKVTDPGYYSSTETGDVYVDPVERTLRQLTYGDKTFGTIGGYGSEGEFDTRTGEYLTADDALARSYAGTGYVDYKAVKGGDGKVYIVPTWGSSSDIDPNLAQFLMIGTSFLMPGLSAALGGGALGAAATGATMGGLGGALKNEMTGGDDLLGSALSGAAKGAAASGLQTLAGPVIGDFAKDAAGLAGGSGTFLGDVASKAVTNALQSGVRALVSGESIGDALTSGAASGALSSAISQGTDTLNKTLQTDFKLPSNIANIASSAIVAEVTGKDPMQAALNTAIRDAVGGASKTAAKAAATTTGAGQQDLEFDDGSTLYYDSKGRLAATQGEFAVMPKQSDVETGADVSWDESWQPNLPESKAEQVLSDATDKAADALSQVGAINQSADYKFETVGPGDDPFSEFFNTDLSYTGDRGDSTTLDQTEAAPATRSLATQPQRVEITGPAKEAGEDWIDSLLPFGTRFEDKSIEESFFTEPTTAAPAPAPAPAEAAAPAPEPQKVEITAPKVQDVDPNVLIDDILSKTDMPTDDYLKNLLTETLPPAKEEPLRATIVGEKEKATELPLQDVILSPESLLEDKRVMDDELTHPQRVDVVGKREPTTALPIPDPILDPVDPDKVVEVIGNKLPPYEHTDEGNLEKVKDTTAAPAPSPASAPSPAPSAAPAPATKPTQKTDTAAKSGFDPMLLALLSALGTQQGREESLPQYTGYATRTARSPFGTVFDDPVAAYEELYGRRG